MNFRPDFVSNPCQYYKKELVLILKGIGLCRFLIFSSYQINMFRKDSIDNLHAGQVRIWVGCDKLFWSDINNILGLTRN